MTFLAATGKSHDAHRKPSPVMWQLFCKNLNGDVTIDYDRSFYCGDAAGRPATSSRPKDHSADDRLFARNSGLNFETPESLFLGERLELPPIANNAQMKLSFKAVAKPATKPLAKATAEAVT